MIPQCFGMTVILFERTCLFHPVPFFYAPCQSQKQKPPRSEEIFAFVAQRNYTTFINASSTKPAIA
jgi:hypothetical protein